MQFDILEIYIYICKLQKNQYLLGEIDMLMLIQFDV